MTSRCVSAKIPHFPPSAFSLHPFSDAKENKKNQGGQGDDGSAGGQVRIIGNAQAARGCDQSDADGNREHGGVSIGNLSGRGTRNDQKGGHQDDADHFHADDHGQGQNRQKKNDPGI